MNAQRSLDPHDPPPLPPFALRWPGCARALGALALAVTVLTALWSCGGGGGPQQVACSDPVCTGFNGDLNWEIGANSGPGDGVGAAGDGDGGVGAGGDFGQFRKALVIVRFPDGREFGRALTDESTGMVTLRPGTYQGPLLLELHGTVDATYYEEGKGTFVPFPEGEVIRSVVPRIERNIGITPFSEVAWRLLTEGTTPERAAGTTPTADEIRAANGRARTLLNQQFPKALEVDDVTRLPFIKSPSIGAGSIPIDARGRYGLVNGAFSKQAAMFNPDEAAPTLAAVRQLSTDMLDGKFDGMNQGLPAVPAAKRTYDVNTITAELSSALAEQTYRFGTDAAKVELPKVLNFGASRYEGYLFDATLDAEGRAFTIVSGWVIEPSPTDSLLGPALGTPSAKNIDGISRIFGMHGNFGHGGVFLKTDASDSRSKVYALGDNINGELGLGHGGGTLGKPEPVSLPGVMTHVAGGFAHTVVRLADGSVYTWGDNVYGQLGQGDAATVTNSTTPLRVTLPRGAVAVAATNVASYALLEDGSVVAWGSNLGFGLLGNGSDAGTQRTPTAVKTSAGIDLTDVVQLAARDNDAVVLRRDGSVLTWGSFPADPAAYDPGDVTQPYLGGRTLATAINGLPAGVGIRKVLTEQGLFAALADDGAVYSWGVHFDMTARGSFAPQTDGMLRDIDAVRVLNLPPVRDLMPGGFIGYGQRTTDRLTAMAISYRGALWKVRGRVAENYDPARPTQQRRPIGSARPDCQSCHVVLSDWPLTPPAATSGTTCTPQQSRPDVHGTPASSLLHADTTCAQCHNPSRTTTNPNFTNGWLNCAPPTDLPARTAPTEPPELTAACRLPANHGFTPPGTVCSSCHNSVIATPLACAQPVSTTLPALPTATAITSINGVTANPLRSNDTTPTLAGTLSAPLAAGQVVRVQRNGASVGAAVVSGTTWSFADGPLAEGSYAYSARVEAGTTFGRDSAVFSVVVDTTPPAATANVTAITDDFGASIPSGGSTSDTTPTISGTLSAALAAGEAVEVVRATGTIVIGTASVTGTTWQLTPTAALPAGAHAIQARAVDSAGNRAVLGSSRGFTIDTSVPLAGALATLVTVNGVAPTAGAVPASNDGTPTLAGTIQRALLAGEHVRIYRNGSAVAGVAATGTSWTYTSAALSSGTYAFLARVEQIANAANFGASSATVSVPIDVTAPTQTVTVSGFSNVPTHSPAAITSGSTTNDPTPTVRIAYGAALGTRETLVITRQRGLDTPITLSRMLRACSGVSNCVEFDDSGVMNAPPSNPTTTGLPSPMVTYTAHVRDSVGNTGPQGSVAFRHDYGTCVRPPIPPHSSSTNCASCHTSSSGLIAAPDGGPTYWCRP